VKNIIKPLEDSGREVDVFLSTSTCSNGMHTKLQDMYNAGRTRVVENHFYTPTRSQFDSASLTADMILKHLKANMQYYDSFLFWRYDLVPLQSLQVQSSGTRKAYLSWANDFFFAHDDQAMSVPGQMAPCLLKALADQCVGPDNAVKTHDWFGGCVKAELRPEDCTEFDWPENALYRGPIGASHWGNQPVRICHFLQDDFGGPSCVAEDMVQTVCRHICPTRQHTETCLSDFWDGLKIERQKLQRQHVLDQTSQDDELEFGSNSARCSGNLP